jgi:hypothetical protein
VGGAVITHASADKLSEAQERVQTFDVGDPKYRWGKDTPPESRLTTIGPRQESFPALPDRVETNEEPGDGDKAGAATEDLLASKRFSARRGFGDPAVTTKPRQSEQSVHSYDVGLIAANALALIFVVIASRHLWRRRKLPTAETDEALRAPSSSLPSLSTFGLNGRSTLDELETAYRELARRLHPDRGGDAEKFKQMHLDYERAKRFLAGRCKRGSRSAKRCQGSRKSVGK